MTEQRLSDTVNDKDVKNQRAKPDRKASFWRAHTKAENAFGSADPGPLLKEALEELARLSPSWIQHKWNADRKKLEFEIDYPQFLEAVRKTTPILFTKRYSTGLFYNGNYWEEFDYDREAKERIKKACIDQLELIGLYAMTSNANLSKIYTFVTTNMVQRQVRDFNKGNLVNFKNGTLNLDTMALHPHRMTDYLTSMLPIDYEASDNGGLVLAYAKHLLGDEAQTLVEWFGYMFYPDNTTLNHIVFMQGVGGNGKSTLLHTFSYALGDLASAYTFSQLAGQDGDRFIDDLATKRANIIGESESYISDKGIDLIKKITGGDSIGANPKNKKAYSVTVPTKFIVSANYRLPPLENTEELKRRFILLSADAPAIDRDGKLDPDGIKVKYAKDKLISALPQFVGYAISQAKKAVERKHLTILPATKARTSHWFESKDLVQRYIDYFIVPTKGHYGASKKYILEHFNDFSIEEVGKPRTMAQFTEDFERHHLEFEPTPRYGREEDAGIVDDYAKSKRNRLKGYGLDDTQKD